MSFKNPAALMKIMAAKKQFTENHPKFSAFINAAFGSGIEAGTIIEITIQKPGQAPMTTNIRVQQSDLDLIEGLKGLVE